MFHWTPEMRVCRSPLRHLVPLLLLSLSLPSPRAYRSVSPCSLTCFALRGHTIPGVIRMRCGIASPVAKAEIGAFSNSFAMKILYSSGTWLICFHKFPVSTSNVEHLEATCRALCEASSLHGGGHAAWPGRPEGGREGRRIPIKPTLWPLAPSSDMNGSLSARQTPTQQPRLSPLPPPLPAHSHSLPRLHYHCLASLVSGKESPESQSGPRSHPRLSCHASSVFITLGLDYRGSWRNI